MVDLAGRPPLGQRTGNPKPSAAGKAHMAAVARLACVICGARPVEVHHVISGRFGQRKAPDTDTIALCFWHHRGPDGIHADKTAWEALHGPDTGFLVGVRAEVARLTGRGI